MITYKLICKAAGRARVQIHCRVTLERKSIYLPTGVYCAKKSWSIDNCRVNKSEAAYLQANQTLHGFLVSIEKKVLEHLQSGHPATYEAIHRLLIAPEAVKQQTTFKGLIWLYCDLKRLSPARIKTYTTISNQFEALNIPANLCQISESEILRYRRSMATAAPNTVTGRLKALAALFSFAVHRGYISKSPLNDLPKGSFKPKIVFLTKSEIHTITDNLPNMLPGTQKAAKLFLFCCFTGLRFSDGINLKAAQIIKGETTYISLKQVKTGTPLMLPVHPDVLPFLPDVMEYCISNQKYNEQLKTVQSICKIKTVLTSHVARHTFATLARSAGVGIATIKDMLGHTSIHNTMIYAHVGNTEIKQAIHKL